jgi:hypothetical protein
MGEVVPLRPRERVELPPPPPPQRKLGDQFPWRPCAAALVPTAALAAAAGLQRWLEGPFPPGDPLARWLLLGSVLGALAGAAAGLALGRGLRGKLLWLAWGASAPWLLALGTLGVARAVRPLRDAVAARRVATCRASGRSACSLAEFTRGCREAGAAPAGARELGRKLLGPAAQELCDAAGCTDRYRYEGPWTPDNWMAPGAVVCSVVSDPQGKGARSALSPGTPPDR